MRILCIGLNHKTADVAMRERLAFEPAQARRALRRLMSAWPQGQFVILSTCNRTELYLTRPVHGHPREEELRHWLGNFHGVSLTEFEGALYTLTDAEAVSHLFAVAAGLDSLVPGEAQIVAQLRAAYATAAELGATAAVMNDLLQMAFHVAKHIRSETSICPGKVSVASVAADCISNVFGGMRGKTVLAVGAGKMSQLMIDRLVGLGAGRIVVTNRSARRAKELAKACAGQAVAFRCLAGHLSSADVIVTSTAARVPIVTREMIVSAQRRRRWRPQLIVDIAVPRDVEGSVGRLKNVLLYNIDDLQRVVRATLKSRKKHRNRAEQCIRTHVDEFMASLNVRQVAPTIDALYKHVRCIVEQELASARNKLTSHRDAKVNTEILKRALHRTSRRILHPCVTNLRKDAGSDAARAHVAAIQKLFELDDD